MITWMQNNNRYLVITIWIATIAFIGAGFVGWGSVNFGSSASSIAKVGDISIPIKKYNFNYSNLYAQKAKELNGKFDKKQAQELGLGKAVLRNLINEAMLLNFAKEYGIVATDKEIGLEIASYNAFKDKNGVFNKSIYDNFLRSRAMKAKDFEAILRDDIIIRKVLKLINIKPLKLEKDAIGSTLNIADKIKYKIIKSSDVKVAVSDDELKKFWEKNKLNYMTKTKYNLDLLWTNAKDINITDSEIEKYYKENSFNYTDKSGKIKDLKDVRDLVINDLKLKKIKKEAAIDRSKFKKSKLKATESVTLEADDAKLPTDVWKTILNAKSGEFLKPKAVKDRYVTIHIKDIIKPRVMNFNEAKELAKKDFEALKKEKELEKLANVSMKNEANFDIEPKDYISLSKFQVLPQLTPQDSAVAIRAIFASSKKINSVKVSNGIVVYDIVEQKILDNNKTLNSMNSEITLIKNSELNSNLLKELASKYKTEVYVKDIK